MIKTIQSCMHNLLKILTALMISACILNIFTFVYKYTGAHVDNPSMATDFKWRAYQYIGGMEEGFSWLRMNDEGFNNSIDRPNSIDVLVMGSSNVEGVNVFQSENMCEVLSDCLPNYTVYNIGVSGHYLNVCSDNLKSAVEEYKPSKYVVIETSNIEPKYAEINEVISKSRNRQVSRKGIIASLSVYVPAVKLLYLKMDEWQSMDKSEDSGENNSDSKEQVDHVKKDILNQYIQKMSDDCGSAKPIIIYHPSTNIDENGQFVAGYSSDDFKEACIENGVVFVDMTKDFQQLYTEQHILAHGFINTAVGYGHLNKHGHRLMGEKLANVIMEDGMQ